LFRREGSFVIPALELHAVKASSIAIHGIKMPRKHVILVSFRFHARNKAIGECHMTGQGIPRPSSLVAFPFCPRTTTSLTQIINSINKHSLSPCCGQVEPAGGVAPFLNDNEEKYTRSRCVAGDSFADSKVMDEAIKTWLWCMHVHF